MPCRFVRLYLVDFMADTRRCGAQLSWSIFHGGELRLAVVAVAAAARISLSQSNFMM